MVKKPNKSGHGLKTRVDILLKKTQIVNRHMWRYSASLALGKYKIKP
jgi:hypothetical protein